ncbi:MAG: IS5 family transposase [Ginsengibacter sp.]
MLKPTIKSPQLGMFGSLADQLDQKHPLFLLANNINWAVFEDAFKVHYSSKMGAPSKPIRLMVSLLILKYLRNLSDENVVEQWSENCYYQYLGGIQFFTPGLPCVPTELVAFRQRIGESGAELILKESIRINRTKNDDDFGNAVSLDSTVQEKNITYPTDDKNYKKIIKKCWKIADEEGIDLRQSYTRTVKKLSIMQRFKKHRNGAKEARKAAKKIKTIAGRLLRETARKLPLERLGAHLPYLKIAQQVLSQKRGDSNKIYSLHEPDVKCYAKGKEHKKFEFGSKASIMVDQSSGIIVGAINFTESLHDSKTIPKALEQYKRLTGEQPKDVFVDRGYRGKSEYNSTKINIPKPEKNISKQKRNGHIKRAGIEPVIGHLKQSYRLKRNFLKGILGDNMNVIFAAAAMNFKRRMILWRTEAIRRWVLLFKFFLEVYWNIYTLSRKVTF